MADCADIQPLILRAADDVLDAAGREVLSTHLATCDPCRRSLAAQRIVKQALADLPLATVSADFAARVRERVASRWIDLFDWRVWTLRLAPVAALLAILAVLPTGVTGAESTNETPQSLTSVLDSWSASRAGAGQDVNGSAVSPVQFLLDPDAYPHALLAAALEETSR